MVRASIARLIVAAAAIVLVNPASAIAAPIYATTSKPVTISGSVVEYDGAYRLRVLDNRGLFESVVLTDATSISPLQVPILVGALVTIHAVTDGRTLVAREIRARPPQLSASAPAQQRPWWSDVHVQYVVNSAPPATQGTSTPDVWQDQARARLLARPSTFVVQPPCNTPQCSAPYQGKYIGPWWSGVPVIPLGP